MVKFSPHRFQRNITLNIKKYILTAMLFVWSISSFAGPEDWKGLYNFKDTNGKTHTIIHSSNTVSFMFMHSGGCIALMKGSIINDLKIEEDVKLCTNANVEKFTQEVAKLGLITHKNIILGSSYSDE